MTAVTSSSITPGMSSAPSSMSQGGPFCGLCRVLKCHYVEEESKHPKFPMSLLISTALNTEF